MRRRGRQREKYRGILRETLPNNGKIGPSFGGFGADGG
jgi:hypothetical protein